MITTIKFFVIRMVVLQYFVESVISYDSTFFSILYNFILQYTSLHRVYSYNEHMILLTGPNDRLQVDHICFIEP